MVERTTDASDGEIFRVTDRRSDGYRVGIVYFGPTVDGFCENAGGTGSTKTCNLSFAEGKSIYYRVYVKNGANGNVIYTSPNIYDVT